MSVNFFNTTDFAILLGKSSLPAYIGNYILVCKFWKSMICIQEANGTYYVNMGQDQLYTYTPGITIITDDILEIIMCAPIDFLRQQLVLSFNVFIKDYTGNNIPIKDIITYRKDYIRNNIEDYNYGYDFVRLVFFYITFCYEFRNLQLNNGYFRIVRDFSYYSSNKLFIKAVICEGDISNLIELLNDDFGGRYEKLSDAECFQFAKNFVVGCVKILEDSKSDCESSSPECQQIVINKLEAINKLSIKDNIIRLFGRWDDLCFCGKDQKSDFLI